MKQELFPQTGNDFAEKVITPEQLRASRQMIDSLKGPITGFVEAKNVGRKRRSKICNIFTRK